MLKALEDAVAARAETSKKAKEEFGVGFFQEYSYLKRKVTLFHLEWEQSGFSGVESDYWLVETLVSDEEVERTGTPPA